MKCKIAGTVGSVLLCAVLLAGCSSRTINTAKDTTEESEPTQIVSQFSQKFVSAENYQKSGEYYKAYILYRKVSPNDSCYEKAQECATQALDLYWKQQDELIEQQDYQTALNNTVQSMNFTNMTTFSGADENGVESTVLRVAENIAENCGYDNPKASWSKIYTISKFTINIDCDGIDGKDIAFLSNDEILRKYDELVNEYESAYKGIFVLTLDEIHSGGKWYSMKDNTISTRSDAERSKDEQTELRKQKTDESSYSGEITQEHRNALSKAERYYHNQDLSKSQVRKQLEYEGYEKDAIDYAMKNLT